MIGVLVLTHGDFAQGLLSSVALIVGKPEKCESYGLYHGDDIEAFKEKVLGSINGLDDGDGVVVFSDLYCASPYNAAAISSKYLNESNYRSISGVNLPMLIEAISMRESMSLEELTNHIMKIGVDGIKEFFQEIKKVEMAN